MANIPTPKELKMELQNKRSSNIRATLKDIEIVRDDYFNSHISQIANYARSKNTRLYEEHSGEYCTLLEILNSHWHKYEAEMNGDY